MKSFVHRGTRRIVGSVKLPSREAMIELHARGMFHELFGSLPAPPAAVDYITPALPALESMLGNGPDPSLPPGVQPMGDCVIACSLHLSAMRATNAGAPWVPTTAEAI